MQLTGQRLKISPLDHSDKDLFIEMFMCPQMMEHVYDAYTYDEAIEAFHIKSKPWTIESANWFTLGITEISTGQKLGNIGLKIINHEARIAEIGFMIKKGVQGKGFAREAFNLLKDYAFNELRLNKLVATCSVNNLGSYKLLENLGFVREGCLQQNSFINNSFVNDYVYGLCKSA
ncbi:MAG: GNAT family N-acetyltransferase [Colwellia sp.]|nr:GNAT family N-acetyltransferase [Colwellia sp.]MCW8864350.1 GNAT family N-acetyltransferase [Colwellia sp.]MCW9081756.1 GNAT family N-acetyltransferase [Colwellia sp.]